MRWIIDSGSGFDLISGQSVTKEDRKMITRTENPCRMATANGITVAEEQLSVRVDGLDAAVDAVILGNSPCNVLSLGKLCMERGFGFEWKSGEPPKLIMPDGSARTLLVDQYVPVLASAVLPKEEVTEQEHNTNVAEASEMSLPHPGGDDLIVGGAPQVVVKREPDGEIVADVPKAPAGGDPRAPKQTSADQLDEKTRHYVTHFPKDSTCPVCRQAKAQKVQHRRKTQGDDQKTGADGNDAETHNFDDLVTANHNIIGGKHENRRNDTVAVAIQDMLAQTPHDIVPREPAHNAGGPANSE